VELLFPDLRKAVGKEETILFLTHLLRYIQTPLVPAGTLLRKPSRVDFVIRWKGRELLGECS
jgi:hypothetical protein